MLISEFASIISQDVIERLNDIKIKTLAEFVSHEVEELGQKCNLSYKELLGIRKLLLAESSAVQITGSSYYNSYLSSTSIFSTGCSGIDSLLDGGLYAGEITEIAGSVAVGKTQFCLSCCASMMTQGSGNALYLDTSGAFSAERLASIAHNNGQNVEESTLTRVRCCQVLDIYDVLNVLQQILCILKQCKQDKFYSDLKLLVVDSIAAVIYPVLGGQQMDGQGFMMKVAQLLKQLASDYSMVILLTNHVVGDEGNKRPGLGRTWSHVPTNRMMIMTNQDHPEIKLVKSSRLKTGSLAQITLGADGVKRTA